MSKKSRFVVSQIDWAKSEYSKDPYLRRTARAEPVASFKSRDAAEFDRRRREDECRATVNPFHYGGPALFYQTSLDAPRLHDWLMDAGIDPPAQVPGHETWAGWWSASVRGWSAEQRAHVWAALDKVQFFTITEEQPDRTVYVIQELNWTWNDESTLQADLEGGNVVRAYRSKKKAEVECARLNRQRQAQADHNGFCYFDRCDRAGDLPSGSRNIRETVFFEVVAVELAEDA